MGGIYGQQWPDAIVSYDIIFKQPSAGCVRTFSDANFGGETVLQCGSLNNLEEIGMGDKISSLYLGVNTSVKFCEHQDLKGKCHVYSPTMNNYYGQIVNVGGGTGFNMFSSLQIQ